MSNLRALPSPTWPVGTARLAIIASLAVALLLAFLPTADANASRGVKLVVAKTASEPGKIRIAARGSRTNKRVAFYIDGRRRWVDRRFQWKFRRGYMRIDRMRRGRHRVTVKARHRHGRVTRATRVFRVTATDKGGTLAAKGEKGGQGKGIGLNKTKPKDSEPEPTPAPEPEPDPAPEPEPDPAPEPEPDSEPAPEPAPEPTPAPADDPLLDAGFEEGFLGWNMNGVGEVEPTIVSDLVRTGSYSSRAILTGSQSRSELMLDGGGGTLGSGTVQFYEGDEYYYAFSFNVRSMVYGRPGAHNLLMQFKSDGTGSPNFGLQLWDYDGKRGLWSHSEAMEGDRYLSPVAHGRWHDVLIYFKASRAGRGFYRLYLDGALVDARDGVSMIRPDRTFGYIKTGLYRNGGNIPGTSEIRLDSALLGTTAEQTTLR